jgi:hypothetical protein
MKQLTNIYLICPLAISILALASATAATTDTGDFEIFRSLYF